MTTDDLEPVGIRRLIDLLLPGDALLPAASSLPEFPELLARAQLASGGMAADVADFASRAASAPDLTVSTLVSWDAATAERVVFVLQSAYYMSNTVRSLLGYPGQVRRPVSEATVDEIADDEILRPVIERGAIYVVPER